MSLANNLYTARAPPAGRNWAAVDLSFSLVVDLSFQELRFVIQIRRPPPFVHLFIQRDILSKEVAQVAMVHLVEKPQS